MFGESGPSCNSSQETKRNLPPRQRPIRSILRWGVDHPGIVKNLPKISRRDWSLKIDGLVDVRMDLSWDDFMGFPQTISISDFHCVETWSVLDQKWEGVLFREIVLYVKPKKTAKFVWFESTDGYTTSLQLQDLMGDDILLAHTLNDEPLPPSIGGPVRLIVPNKYAYKSPMWVEHIEFLSDDRLGFWEKGIYSNSADVWTDDRYI